MENPLVTIIIKCMTCIRATLESNSNSRFKGTKQIRYPTFPLIAYFVIEMYEYVHRLIVGASLAIWGFFPSMIILFAIEFVLLAVSILILASQATKIREDH